MIKIRIREVNLIGEKFNNISREEQVGKSKEMIDETIEIIETIETIEIIEIIEITEIIEIEIIIEKIGEIMIISKEGQQSHNSQRHQIKSNKSLRKNNKINKGINLK